MRPVILLPTTTSLTSTVPVSTSVCGRGRCSHQIAAAMATIDNRRIARFMRKTSLGKTHNTVKTKSLQIQIPFRLRRRSESREPPPYGERDRDSEARRGVGHTPDAAAFRRGDRSGPGGQTANDWLPYQGEFDPNSEAGDGVFGPEFAVVEADGAGGDGQAEDDAAGGGVERIVEADEGLED